MLKIAMKIVLALAVCATPVLIAPVAAQAQNDAQQRAYQAGYQNGVNDRNQNKPLNLTTDNWHGQNLNVYQRGYQDGYGRRGNGRETSSYDDDRAPRAYGQNDAQQRAYQAGYQNGVNDRNQNKPLNLKTDNWHGQNLSVYQRGYKEGYRGGDRDTRDHNDH
jgi:ribosome modulation factor